MAKQTFTTGQVLSAAQLTSLQQTAMGGGAATAKTASYVLVAADAGTTVAMNAAGATTITVNTGLFAAGDTVFIQNLGAGACTVTAGTATVATAGSLILPQNDAGILYFTATGASIFYDFIQAGAVSPLTTKGDVYTFSTSDARLGVGANDTVLTADSAEATGLKWATPVAAGKSYTLLNSGGTALSGSNTVTISGISNVDTLFVVYINAERAAGGALIQFRINGDTGTNYDLVTAMSFQPDSTYNISTFTVENNTDNTYFLLGQTNGAANAVACGTVRIDGCNGAGIKPVTYSGGGRYNAGGGFQMIKTGTSIYNSTSTVSSISLLNNSGNFTGGTIYVYTTA